MRLVLVIATGLLIGFGAGAARAAAAQAKQGDLSSMVDQLAEKVFTGADTNHNHLLNKREFANAETMLETQIDQLGSARIIGKPRTKGSGKGQEKAALAAASTSVSAEKLAKSNKVTQAEFTIYVHSLVEEADELWRQTNTMADAQRKAYNAQRASMGNRRYYRRPRTINYPYYYY